MGNDVMINRTDHLLSLPANFVTTFLDNPDNLKLFIEDAGTTEKLLNNIPDKHQLKKYIEARCEDPASIRANNFFKRPVILFADEQKDDNLQNINRISYKS